MSPSLDGFKISVIIPIYNTAEYLPRCLDSVLGSTYRNLEVICVDDGSTDQSSAILDSYAATDPRLVVIHKANGGVSSARNTGLDRATGEFVAFIDSDDWVHRQYFELLVHLQRQANADIAMCDYQCVTALVPDGTVDVQTVAGSHLSAGDLIHSNHLKRFVVLRIYRKTCIDGHRFPLGVKWGEDMPFNLNILCQHADLKIVTTDLRLYYYYQRASSAVNSLKSVDKLQVGRVYLSMYETTQREDHKQLFLAESAKQVLSCRYAAIVCREKAAYLQCKNLVSQCKKAMRHTPHGTERSRLPLLFRIPRCVSGISSHG